MRRYWQKKPLLIRQAVPGFQPLLDRQALFALAGQEGVESRLIVHGEKGWTLRHGPFQRRAFPPLSKAGWTMLVQGVDLHHDGVHALMQQFRFVPDARLDDIMISWASAGGGVGPHFDSYDVFLLQASGRRRWRIGRNKDKSLQEGVPLRILSNFEPEEEHLLEPGDMLYLPPGWAHDGVAEPEGDCMTYSVGFRVPQRGGLAGELMHRMADELEDEALYRDPQQAATEHPSEMPVSLQRFARESLTRMVADDKLLERALGEVMTEPKPGVWFDADESAEEADEQSLVSRGIRLDRRTRMMYDKHHVFINGESYRAAGADARLMRALADRRELDGSALKKASEDARSLLAEWCEAGWLHLQEETP
ncbi:cupin domain-containing protein [Hydrogenophaga sp. 5NK40-0174]